MRVLFVSITPFTNTTTVRIHRVVCVCLHLFGYKAREDFPKQTVIGLDWPIVEHVSLTQTLIARPANMAVCYGCPLFTYVRPTSFKFSNSKKEISVQV